MFGLDIHAVENGDLHNSLLMVQLHVQLCKKCEDIKTRFSKIVEDFVAIRVLLRTAILTWMPLSVISGVTPLRNISQSMRPFLWVKEEESLNIKFPSKLACSQVKSYRAAPSDRVAIKRLSFNKDQNLQIKGDH